MRTGESVIKKGLVVSLLVIYLAIALTYILYLPKYNPLRLAHNQVQTNTQLVLNTARHTDSHTGNILVLLHHVYRTSIENKRNPANGLSQLTLILASLIIGNILARRGRWQNAYSYLKFYSGPRQCLYLNYRTLRI